MHLSQTTTVNQLVLGVRRSYLSGLHQNNVAGEALAGSEIGDGLGQGWVDATNGILFYTAISIVQQSN
eukprot:6956727-Ditylum_brightwellii.AAC.1